MCQLVLQNTAIHKGIREVIVAHPNQCQRIDCAEVDSIIFYFKFEFNPRSNEKSLTPVLTVFATDKKAGSAMMVLLLSLSLRKYFAFAPTENHETGSQANPK